MYPFQPFSWANLLYPFIHLSEPQWEVYHPPNTSLLRQTIPGMKAREKVQRWGEAGMNSCAMTKRPRVHSWPSPDLTCVADQVPFPLWGCPSTWRGPNSQDKCWDSGNFSWKISAMTLMSCPPLLPPILFTFILLLSVFLLPFCSLLCRPPIMVTNLAIIFLICISCSPQPGWAERVAVILKRQSLLNPSHRPEYWWHSSLLKILCLLVYMLSSFPSN